MAPNTRKFPGDFAGAFIPRASDSGVIQVLVIGVLPIGYRDAGAATKLQKMQIKMPGGCAENEKENNDLRLALGRELRYEIGAGSPMRITAGDVVFRREKRRGSSVHHQVFYLVEVGGELRTSDLIEDEGDEVITPPAWADVRGLIEGGIIFHSHLEPLLCGIERLALESAAVAREYADILNAKKNLLRR